ncbi:glycogen synthase GlgA [candidate division GN15 bacterium]|nr:glycogen synthase GlgA [candidate division GN15 bacterium]
MSKLKICMVSSEAGPYARTGGLGDVLASLPLALSRRGYDVSVVLPLYGSIDRGRYQIAATGHTVRVPIGGRDVTGTLHVARSTRHNARYYFLENDTFFKRPEYYRDPATGGDYTDNDQRFAFLARGAIEAVKHLNWAPDVMHVHDWQAALVPAYLRTVYDVDSFFAHTKTVLTIHNLGYQGMFGPERFDALGLPHHQMYAVSGPLEFFGQMNFLKGGIALADKVTTVSERYAEEIQSTEEFGFGLQGILSSRSDDLHGILNGVDYSLWSPSRDKLIPHKFTTSNLSGKKTGRVELMNKAGLPIRNKVPLIGMITRLTDQKGVDLICDGGDQLFRRDIQMVILGVGDDHYHQRLKDLERDYPDKLKVFLEFNDILAHWIQSGVDMFLMPSRYEPCGLNQMYALRYGSVPIVRSTGGLADTVEDYNPETKTGTGFVFERYSIPDMLGAIDRAVTAFQRRQSWIKLMKAGMARDFSWDRSAEKYAALYQSIAEPAP